MGTGYWVDKKTEKEKSNVDKQNNEKMKNSRSDSIYSCQQIMHKMGLSVLG